MAIQEHTRPHRHAKSNETMAVKSNKTIRGQIRPFIKGHIRPYKANKAIQYHNVPQKITLSSYALGTLSTSI